MKKSYKKNIMAAVKLTKSPITTKAIEEYFKSIFEKKNANERHGS